MNFIYKIMSPYMRVWKKGSIFDSDFTDEAYAFASR